MSRALLLPLTLLLACQPPAEEEPPVVAGPPVFGGPGAADFDAELAAKVDLFDRQFLAINASPYGMSLDAYVPEPASITAWLEQGSGYETADYEAFAGHGVYDDIMWFDEMGDLGMFGGVAGIAEAARYKLLRDDPASVGTDTVDAARARLERLMSSLHIMQAITGQPGVLVRGLAKRDMPWLADYVTTPLADADGNPLPTDKGMVWREDFSGQYPDWVWLDDTSKDQLIGYIAALATVWEVVHDDETIDPALKEALQSDALALGRALMVPSPVSGLDLTLMDADGRPVNHHDLNAREIESAVADEAINPFNALAATSTLRVLATVSGDAELEAFYREVAIDRAYAELGERIGGVLYLGWRTNYSNVNMAFTALYSELLLEEDADLRASYVRALESAWGEGLDRAPWHFHNAWFSVIRAAHLPGYEEEVQLAIDNLKGFHDAPYLFPLVENCDADELAAGQCIGVDGVTPIELYGWWEGDTFVLGSSRNEFPVATSEVPMHLRCASNFEWRSDPYRVNCGGTDRLAPGGDLRAAYWAGRLMERAR